MYLHFRPVRLKQIYFISFSKKKFRRLFIYFHIQGGLTKRFSLKSTFPVFDVCEHGLSKGFWKPAIIVYITVET